MSQQQGKKKKISISEALEELRSSKKGKSILKNAPARAPRTATASFWLQNLLESVHRRQEQLFESLLQDPGAQAHLMRRDFFPSEQIYVPFEELDEYLYEPPSVARKQRRKVVPGVLDTFKGSSSKIAKAALHVKLKKKSDTSQSRFHGASTLEVDINRLEEVTQEPPEKPKKLRVNPLIQKMFNPD